MKNILLTLVGVLVGINCIATPYVAVPVTVSSVSRTNVQTTTTSGTCFGKLVAAEFYAETNMDYNVYTTDGKGASLSGSKTILANASAVNGHKSNLVSVIYMYGDTIVVAASNCQSGANNSLKALFIFDR